ncbi:ABC transporter substrate-binding protein [Paenibacillus mucilaginosus]|uniref:Extracellular solute-binding protein family 1 n=1 Tax=Paenibacillus mucilaginosus (strain KNP414) TaxID=1036673 RepID=F8FIR0_PAEMK|nr:ABC transporter substrate-binding protein [Paenibacillus mucilaginosus]AEI45514.1 extracellular solute-binding protein family 1 [Paenibacillus mucilaginosus KNP414]MCG7215270.1 ABC transporter substrate-binding protein [Paenibacillus mucilaginosus]WDM26936.1 carbohydrate ABC transporter substrate-binding protein [Paenibacillus mucilaginosus]
MKASDLLRRFTAALPAFCLAVLAGCSQPADPPLPAPPADSPAVSQGSVELTMWTYYPNGWDATIAGFRRHYPEIDIKVEVHPFAEYSQKYLAALADGTAPDILMVDSAHLGEFGAIEGVENLLSPPYEAGRYQAGFSPAMWDSMLSLDGGRLIALPLATAPSLTYYRADLLKAYGFPDEPEALGTFMEDPANWLAMGEELLKHGSYITQWDNELIRFFEASTPLFDRNLNFQRSSAEFERALDLAKEVNHRGLDANVDVWNEVGEKAVRSGRIAMLYLGTWGADQIQAWAPELEGKWRAARLPFGLYGFENSSSFLLPSQGRHKAEAWKFIEHSVTVASKDGMGGSIPAYLPARGNPVELERANAYLGGQRTYALFEELAGRMKERTVTPLDKKAQAIWSQAIVKGVEADQDSKALLEEVRKEIEKRLGRDKEILLEWKNKQ